MGYSLCVKDSPDPPCSPLRVYPCYSYSGYNVVSASVDLSVGAERTTVLKAVSEGETRFRSLAMASDTDQAFPSPDGPGRQFLAEFGDFPVYLVNRDLQASTLGDGRLLQCYKGGRSLGQQ